MVMRDDSVELIDYLRVIRKRKGLIIIGTFVCMVAAGAVSFMLPKVYETSVVFLLEESRISQEKVVSSINPLIFDTYGKTYEGIIKNRNAMNGAMEKFHLAEEPYGLTLEDLDTMISVSAVKKSKLLELTVRFPDPLLSKDIANFLADKAVALNTALSAAGSAENKGFIKHEMESAKGRLDAAEDELLGFREKAQLEVLKKRINILLSRKGEIEKGLSHAIVAIGEGEAKLDKIVEIGKKEGTGSNDFIKRHMQVAKAELDKAEGELLEFKVKARLEVLKKRINVLLSRKGEIEKGLFSADVSIAENVERLKKIEEEFNKRDRTIKLSRKLVEDPLYQQSLAGLSESEIRKMFNLNMEVEEADPAYQHLEKKLVDILPALSGLYARRDALQAELKRNTSELNELQIEMANKQVELQRLESDFNVAKENYAMFLKKVDVVPALSGLYARKSSLEAELKENTSQLKTFQQELANKEVELERLKRTYGLAVSTYKMLAKRFEEITLQVASRSQELKVLDPAVIPERPVKPRKKFNVLVAGALGSIGFLFLAFLMESLEVTRKEERDSD